MEKAKITKSGNGWKLDFNNGKNPTIFNCTNITTAWEKKEIEAVIVERQRIILKKDNIYLLGEVIRSDRGINLENENVGNNIEPPNVIDSARAPYNFTPLNETIVLSEELPEFDKYDSERLNGFIDFRLQNLTPFFIRKEKGNSNFFAIKDGKPIIPGSSIRGMIRSLVEQASWSRILITDREKRYFYRNIKDNEYKLFMMDQNGYNIVIKAKAGWLKYENRKYCFSPAIEDENGLQFYRVNGSFINRNSEFQTNNNRGIINVPLFAKKQIFFDNSDYVKIKNKVINGRTFMLEYNILRNIYEHNKPNFQTGYLWATGFINRKHFQWIFNESDDTIKTDVTEQMKIYSHDDNRDEKINLIKWTKDGESVPCFYIEKDNEIIAIGHTGMFRLPYDKNVNDKIPGHLPSKEELNNETYKLDMTEAIFGTTKTLASRVFFEDGQVKDSSLDVDKYEKYPKILSSPKPTTYQHYLETKNNEIQSWNKDSSIRGFKNYWHKINTEWNEINQNEIRQKKKIYDGSQIKVINKSTFNSRIRFENLTKVELGALLFVLDLPEGCCHKLGMGKPLGLGSVKIDTIKIINFNRKERYNVLLDEKGSFHYGESEIQVNKDEFKNLFAEFICKTTNNIFKDFNSLWDNSRLKELKTLLTFNHNILKPNFNWLERTRYMEITRIQYNDDGNIKTKILNNGNIVNDTKNEFGDRPVLPIPTKVIEKDTYSDC